MATQAEWTELRSQKLHDAEYRPRKCRGCPSPALGLHHLVPKSQLGDDFAENLVPLCGDGTRGCHGKVQQGDPETCKKIRDSMLKSESAYCVLKMGESWLEQRYPASL